MLQLRLKRGTTTQNNAFTGNHGEVSLDMEVGGLRLHDGSTPGGLILPTATDKTKLDAIEANATANASDLYLLDRTNHSGTQAISTITGLTGALSNKTDITRTLTITNGTGITGGDSGDLSTDRSWTLSLTGQALAFHNLATNGLVVRTNADTIESRSLAVLGVGLSVNNANGIAGNPTVVSNATDTNTVSTIVARDTSGNFSAGTISAALSGNASSATVLQTPRTLWGQSFDGSANITGAMSGITTLGLSDQLTSTLVTGTAPLVVASTTRVANLNVAAAGTADILLNSRTINGTAFDGSSNITTESWGTARTLSFNGDMTGSNSVDGSGNVAFTLTLANSGVTPGTYNNVATTARAFTVDAKGRITSVGEAVTVTPAWSSITSKPTTLSGYGITDATPSARSLAIANGVGITGGAAYDLTADRSWTIALTGQALALHNLGTNGFFVRSDVDTVVARSIAVSGVGLSVTNGNGVSGNPTITSNATDANTASTLVARDSSGNFTAGIITAALTGNASTSTTLQTARNINGTSFNGSADITTNSWGTSRDVSMGNSTKAVNGSANVSFSLDEMGAAHALLTINNQTGTTYSPVLGDANNTLVTLENDAPILVTIPLNATVAYSIGTRLHFAQIGPGQATIEGAVGVTIGYDMSLTNKLNGEYASVSAILISTDRWLLTGNLEAV